MRAVIGISGGLDSSVTAWITAETMRRAKRNNSVNDTSLILIAFKGISEEDLTYARRFSEELSSAYHELSIDYQERDLTELFKDIDRYTEDIVSSSKRSKIYSGELATRLIDCVVLEVADKTGHCSMDSTNGTEIVLGEIVLGAGAECAPIADFYKSQVYDLGKLIGVPEFILVRSPINSPEGEKYFTANLCALNYSYANRQVIAHLVRESFKRVLPNSEIRTFWDLTHNSARWEIHEVDGKRKKLLVHRKGSTRAFGPGREELPEEYRETGQPVIIGGTMGSYSYILKGTKYGMEHSFGSACHGAGRAMSRTQAKKRWYGEKLAKELERSGIYIRCHSWSGLAEEAPDAYKDVREVIDSIDSANLAKKVIRMRPLATVKG